ncbi:MAG: TAXI family TRAP transporter solute-binding subunit [Chloroflexota bacterium]
MVTLVIIASVLLAACQSVAAPAPTAVPKVEAKPPATTALATTALATAMKPGATSARASSASPVAPASPSAVAVKSSPARAPMDQGPCVSANATRARPAGKARLVIGTGGTGGVFFPFGSGLARIITAKLPNTELTAEVTGGSVDNMKLIHSGEADLGLSTADSAYDAVNGIGAYADTRKIQACIIANLYVSFIHIVALDGSGINSVEDMLGKRISVGSAGSSTEGAAERILEAAGLDPRKDITRDALGVAESVAAMKDGQIDAFFWIGGLPTAAVTDLASAPNTKVRFIKADQYLPALTERYGPQYTALTLPMATYPGLDADVPGIGIGNILSVSVTMNEGLVHDLLRTIFDNLAEVQQIHPEARTLTLESAASASSIPFHPGAIKFYQEKGVWTP